MELMAFAIIFVAVCGLVGWIAWLAYKSDTIAKPEPGMYTWKKTTTYKPKIGEEGESITPPSSPPSSDEVETKA